MKHLNNMYHEKLICMFTSYNQLLFWFEINKIISLIAYLLFKKKNELKPRRLNDEFITMFQIKIK